MKKILTVLMFLFSLSVFVLAESCTSEGSTQTMYTINGCGESASSRVCCRGTWCNWGITGCVYQCTATSESRNCSGNVSNSVSGTQTRTRSVSSGCGGCSYSSWGSWSGKCTCASNYYWNYNNLTCVACGSTPNQAPYQYSNNTTPTAAQYKANASMCQFKWSCIDGSGWASNPGTGLDFCACIGGYTWDSSTQTCKASASSHYYTVSTSTQSPSCQSNSTSCNSMKSAEYSGRMSSGGYVYGSITSSSCPGKSGFTQTSCSYNSSQGKYCYTTTIYSCVYH